MPDQVRNRLQCDEGTGAKLGQLLCAAVMMCLCAAMPARAQECSSEHVPVLTDVDTARTPRLWGIADTHAHPFANLGFGEHIFWGSPFDTTGDPADTSGALARALGSCAPIHGADGLRDLIGYALAGHMGHAPDGMPNFADWPAWNTLTHQQMYVDWLDRAREGGLRLVVALAVHAEALCKLRVVDKPRYADHSDPCDDMTVADRQLDAIKRMEAYVDARAGGPDRGWFRIVRTPQEARAAIAKNQLAVVLGIEVDSPFGCHVGHCTADSVERALDTYVAKGVRTIFPIHLADNAFGGSSLFEDFFYFNTYKLTDDFPRLEHCGDPSLVYHFSLPSIVGSITELIGLGKPPHYTKSPHCNKLGLTPLGDSLVRGMMKRGMILEIDHMSAEAAARTIVLARQWNYPIAASHTGFLDISLGAHRHEGQKTKEQLTAIRETGGMVSAILTQGKEGELDQWVDPGAKQGVVNDCAESSKAWAQAYLYAVHQMGGNDGPGVGLATDQTFNPWTGPRFGPHGCGNDREASQRQSQPVTYPFWVGGKPFPRSKVGRRDFDFNEDGFAHIGLLPDFIQDLKNVGVDSASLKPLYHSADQYVRMWERAVEASTRMRDSLARARKSGFR